MTTRKTFLEQCFAFGVSGALGWAGRAAEPEAGAVLPAWKPGEMELHFIYTGCGENVFLRLPDGTAILNDTGDYYRPRDLAHVPLLPSPDRLGGEWVSRYIARVYPERTIDYALFSHWHADHIGHCDFGKKTTPEEDHRYKTLSDGRKVNGFLCVAEDFRFRRCFDHQFPARGQYGTHDSSMDLLMSWIAREQKRGLVVEPFRVGALNQIFLQRDPAKYREVFSVRNLCANGVAWDGKGGVRDFAAEHVAATGRKTIAQNQLSMGYVIRYGAFRYFAGGDIQHDFYSNGAGKVNFEAFVAQACGPVSVCKMNHHGCTNAMSAAFARGVRAAVYTACMWCPRQAHPDVLKTLAATRTPQGEAPLLVPNLVTDMQWNGAQKGDYRMSYRGACHVVVKVAPGGDTYRVYLLDATDEKMRILATFDRRSNA